jgi:hypothetical protein
MPSWRASLFNSNAHSRVCDIAALQEPALLGNKQFGIASFAPGKVPVSGVTIQDGRECEVRDDRPESGPFQERSRK